VTLRRILTTAIAAVAVLAGPAATAGASTTLPAPYVAISANGLPGAPGPARVASLERLRALGVRAVRIDFRWADIEPIGPPLHDYDWSAQDALVRDIRAAGLEILGIIDYGHPDYSAAGRAAYDAGRRAAGSFGVGDPEMYPPDDPASFARFAADVASRYRHDVGRWEIWNEENGGWRFWLPKEDPAAYARLLCAAHTAVHAADPGAPVALGGLFFPPLGGHIGTGGVRFLRAVLDRGPAGVGQCFDAVAFHPYAYPFTSPEAVVQDRGSVIGAAAQLRQVLAAHHLAATPLWNTEVGWPTNPVSNGVTEARQARYTARLALLSWARGVRLLTWYTVGDTPDATGKDQEAHFGLFRLDGSAKPAARALETLQRTLGDGLRYVGDRSRTLGLPRGHAGVGQGVALEFRGPGRRHVLALWLADERPPAGPSPFAPVEPGTPRSTIVVRLTVPRPASVTTMLGVARGALPASGLVRVGQDPVYVAWRG